MNLKKIDYKRIMSIIILFSISLFISYKIVDMIIYDYMFVVDMSKENDYRVVNSYENGISYNLTLIETYYETDIPDEITGYDLHLKIKLNEDEKRIEEVIYNGEILESQNVIKLTDYSKYDESYEDMPLFMINRNQVKKMAISIIVALFITSFTLLIFIKEKSAKKNNEKEIWSVFTYSNTFFKMLNKKDFIILFIIFLVTFFIIVGCDAKVIANVGNLFFEDIDIYQLQVNTRFITGREYAEFPYNPLMLCIWGGIMSIFRPITKALPVINNYPYWEVGILKAFNLLFIFMTISAVLSYLLDNKFIDEKKAKWIYYISLFNPVTFYVAILFVQLDALTLYLIIVGTLLLHNLNEDRVLGIVYLTIGIMLKMQILFLMPIAVMLILYIIFYSNKDRMFIKFFRLLKCIGIFLGIAIFTFALPYLLKTPFYYLESNLEQSERLWYTVIQYASDINLYVALGCLAGAMIIFALNIHSKVKKENFILSSIMYYAVIILLFSFSIMPTPSIYIVTLGGFIVLTALEKDKLKNIVLTIISILIIVCPMFSDYGDISKIFRNPNEQGIITNIMQGITERKSFIKINSAIFTISAIAMLIYALYIGRNALKLLQEKKNNEKNNN